MKKFEIIREIGIDVGHRVTHHGSKCRNLHGHRYTIHACVRGDLFETGEQQGMVLDFSFLKDLMLEYIDAFCDHGMVLWIDDPLVMAMTGTDVQGLALLQNLVAKQGSVLTEGIGGKLYLVPFVPTAENLAKHWYEKLKIPVAKECQGFGHLAYIKVWETPNGSAIYPAQSV